MTIDILIKGNNISVPRLETYNRIGTIGMHKAFLLFHILLQNYSSIFPNKNPFSLAKSTESMAPSLFISEFAKSI